MNLKKLLTFGSKAVGIDLGTANILVTLKGKGIILKEPSVVAINRKTGNIMATGTEAKEMLGRTPEQIKAVRPLKDGVIADFTATQLMLKNIIPPRKSLNHFNRQTYIIFNKQKLYIFVPDFSNLSYTLPITLEK